MKPSQPEKIPPTRCPQQLLEYLAKARFAEMVPGARVPVVLTSRSDPNAAKLASLALARVTWAQKRADSAAKLDAEPGGET